MRSFYFILFLMLPIFGFAQIVTVDYILKQEVVKQESGFIDPDKLPFYETPVAFEFDNYKLNNPAALKLLKSKTIYRVELYYSSYRSSDKFSQQALNRKRIIALRDKLPSVFANNAIEWKLIEQVQNEDEDKAKKLFHGFVFYSREPYAITRDGKKTEITTREEIEIIKNYLGDLLPIEYDSRICFTFKKVCDTTVASIPDGFTRKRIYSGLYWPKRKSKKDKGILYKKKSIWNRQKEYMVEEHPKFKTRTTIVCSEKMFGEPYIRLVGTIDEVSRFSLAADSVVIKMMNKNRNNFQNALVVEDVTGSMHPYLAQTFKWRRLWIASTKVNHFAFFNDGDAHPDGPIGDSQGVYSIVSDSIDVVENTAYSTMQKGSGGGGPENNIEAMITRGYRPAGKGI